MIAFFNLEAYKPDVWSYPNGLDYIETDSIETNSVESPVNYLIK